MWYGLVRSSVHRFGSRTEVSVGRPESIDRAWGLVLIDPWITMALLYDDVQPSNG
jgi:hypothetical protein